MLVVLPDHHPFFDPFPPLSLAVITHGEEDECIDEFPINNPANKTNEDNDGDNVSTYKDDNGSNDKGQRRWCQQQQD